MVCSARLSTILLLLGVTALCSARVTIGHKRHTLSPHGAVLEEESGEFEPGFIDFVKQVENGGRKGYNSRTGLWNAHDSPEGGTQTIGYGHKFRKGEHLSGLTDTQVEQLLIADLKKARARAASQYATISGTACSWDELDTRQKDMLTDYAFNVGSITKFPKFTRALSRKDFDGMLAEYERTYRDASGVKRSLGRNKHFRQRYLASRSQWTGSHSSTTPIKHAKAISKPASPSLVSCSYNGQSGVCLSTSQCKGTSHSYNRGRGALGCQALAKHIQCCVTSSSDPEADADDEAEDGKDNDSGELKVPSYKQCDAQWACHPYTGSGCSTTRCKARGYSKNQNNMCASACGVASSAMLLSFHEQKSITPVTVADWLMAKKYRGSGSGHPHGATCSGTSHIAISKVAEEYGYTARWQMTAGKYPGSVVGLGGVSYSDYEPAIQSLLNGGNPVILHVREVSAGTCKYTNGGHYIVLTSYDPATKHYRVNDPGSSREYRTFGTRKQLFKDCAVAGYTAFRK